MVNDEIILDRKEICEDDNAIEFCGIVSERARIDRMKRINRVIIIPLIILEAVFISIIAWVSLRNAFNLLAIFIPLSIICLITIIMMYVPFVGTRLWYDDYLTLPITVTISNGIITNSYFDKSHLVSGKKSVLSVKRVIDVGEWYYVIFKFGDIGNSWICQKDLLTKGTLEQFENIFNDRIVRK